MASACSGVRLNFLRYPSFASPRFSSFISDMQNSVDAVALPRRLASNTKVPGFLKSCALRGIGVSPRVAGGDI
jgi:hypothetical protein